MTSVAIPAHGAQNALNARILLALVAIRILAGCAENIGLEGASEIAALAMLAGALMIQALDFAIARRAVLFCLGLATWMLAAAISALANDLRVPEAALELFALLALYMSFANLLWHQFRSAGDFARIQALLGFFTITGGLFAIVQIVLQVPFVEPGKPDVFRATGSDVHPVSFGIQMVICLVGLEIARRKQQARLNPLTAATYAIGAIALYLTFARTAWAMLAIVVAIHVAFNGRGPGRVLRLAGLIVLALPALALSDRFSDLASFPVFLENFDPSGAVFDYRYVDNSLNWRVVNWSIGLHQALDNLAFGVGPGQSAVASAFNLEMHNILLELFFELGVPGIAAAQLMLAGLVSLHRALPWTCARQSGARILANALGVAMLAAVMLSTSIVDQLMTVIMYLLVLRLAGLPAR